MADSGLPTTQLVHRPFHKEQINSQDRRVPHATYAFANAGTQVEHMLSSAARERIAEAYKFAADEQYDLANMLSMKAASLLGNDSRTVSQDTHACKARDGEGVVGKNSAQNGGQEDLKNDDHSISIETDVFVDKTSEDGIQEVSKSHDRDASIWKAVFEDKTTQTLEAANEPTDARWKPQPIKDLPAFETQVKIASLESFTWQTIVPNLGGREWASGFYYVDEDSFSSDSPLEGKTFWVLEGHVEPFVAKTPGEHCAKLTAFFREDSGDNKCPEEHDYINTPVFVSLEANGDYYYMGHYSQCRWSDKLDCDTMQRLPQSVLEYWADILSDVNRPQWLTKELIEYLWPKPHYTGPLPAEPGPTSVEDWQVTKALWEYAEEIKTWEEFAREQVSELTKDKLMAAYKHADFGTERGLRLNWEYLQCVKWDQSFYDKLVQFKHGINPLARPWKSKSKKKRCSQEYKLTVPAAMPSTHGQAASTPDNGSPQPASEMKDEKAVEQPKPPKPRYLAPHERNKQKP